MSDSSDQISDTGGDPNPPSASSSAPDDLNLDPYKRLGLTEDASFDAVQQARQSMLTAAGDDPMARARVEAAYDAVLMNRLVERKQGKLSTEARSASDREQLVPPPSGTRLPSLPVLQLPKVSAPRLTTPRLTFADGQERGLVLGGFALLLALLVLSSAPAELVLALGTGLCVICLQRRRPRFLAAVGWGFGLLSLGLVLGAVLVGASSLSLLQGLSITADQLQSLPALLLLLLGALLVE